MEIPFRLYLRHFSLCETKMEIVMIESLNGEAEVKVRAFPRQVLALPHRKGICAPKLVC